MTTEVSLDHWHIKGIGPAEKMDLVQTNVLSFAALYIFVFSSLILDFLIWWKLWFAYFSPKKKNNLLLFFYLHKKDIPETSGRVRDVQVVLDLEELVSAGFHLKDRVGIVHHRAGAAGRTWEDRLLHSVKAEHLGNHHKEVLIFVLFSKLEF